MSGKATFTIERSSEAMNVPSAVTTKTAPARGARAAGRRALSSIIELTVGH